MAFDPSLHHRRSIRLRDRDYARPGLYFVTICTRGRACLFGGAEVEGVRLNAMGRTAEKEWLRTPEVRPNVVLDAFVVMPNHVHLLFGIVEPTVGAIMGRYKSAVTKRINALRRTPGAPVWQRNYHERVVRNAREADLIRRYIRQNPRRWHLYRYPLGR